MSTSTHDLQMIEKFIREKGVTRCPTPPCNMGIWGRGHPPIRCSAKHRPVNLQTIDKHAQEHQPKPYHGFEGSPYQKKG